MKNKNLIILGILGLTGIIVARYLISKGNGEEKLSGLLTEKDIERLYSLVKL